MAKSKDKSLCFLLFNCLIFVKHNVLFIIKTHSVQERILDPIINIIALAEAINPSICVQYYRQKCLRYNKDMMLPWVTEQPLLIYSFMPSTGAFPHMPTNHQQHNQT